MNNLRNTVQIVGRVGNDLELNTYGDEKIMTKFSIAYTDLYKDNNGETVTNTHWFQVVAWGSLAERAQSSISKGDEVVILGKLIANSYTNKEGQNRKSIEINLDQYMVTKSNKESLVEAS